MKKDLLLAAFALLGGMSAVNGQGLAVNDAERASRLSIGGYGTIDYVQPIKSGFKQNGNLDVSRVVMMMNYQFSSKTSFHTEIEFEHVKEIWIEQAYLNHRFDERLQLKAGLLLTPFGIVNEYHEPTSFNGVLRPAVDNNIIPSTWREIGAGFQGRFSEAGLGYQVYVMNGFKSYDGGGLLGGSSGLRGGRQKGAKAVMGSPSVAARLTYDAVPNLVLGVSGYFGETGSTLFNKLDKSNHAAMAKADSSVVNISMVGADYRYSIGNFKTRGVVAYASLANVAEYNKLTKKDLGSAMLGYYVEFAYDLFAKDGSGEGALTPFVRYEKYDTNYKVASGATRKDAYNKQDWVFGVGYRIAKGAVLKADYLLSKSKADDSAVGTLNLGVGVTF